MIFFVTWATAFDSSFGRSVLGGTDADRSNEIAHTNAHINKIWTTFRNPLLKSGLGLRVGAQPVEALDRWVRFGANEEQVWHWPPHGVVRRGTAGATLPSS